MTARLEDMVYERFLISSDMNHDGVVSISDVVLWLKWLYFLPGDLAALVLLGTPVGDFFEITQHSAQGLGSGILSFCFWYVVFEILFSRR